MRYDVSNTEDAIFGVKTQFFYKNRKEIDTYKNTQKQNNSNVFFIYKLNNRDKHNYFKIIEIPLKV